MIIRSEKAYQLKASVIKETRTSWGEVYTSIYTQLKTIFQAVKK